MPFNPDQYLASKSTFDPDAYLSTKLPITSQPSELESAGRGLAQGASLGFADELTGGAEALKDELSNQAGDKSFGDLYRQHRDESRAAYDAAQKANPKSFLAGELGGGLATALVPGLNVAKGATLGARAAGAAALGGTYALGNSKADVTQGDIGGALEDTAKGAALGAVAQPVIEKVVAPVISSGLDKLGDVGQYILKKTGNGIFGVNEGTTERYLQNPDAINSASNLTTLAQEKLPQALGNLREDSSFLANQAAETLSTDRNILTNVKLTDVLNTIPDGPSTAGIKQDLMNSYMQRSNGISPEANAGNLTQQEIKDTIKRLDDEVLNWNKVRELTPGDQAAIRGARGQLSNALKDVNPEYGDAMGDLADNTSLKKNLAQKFGLEFDPNAENGIKATDRSVTALKQLSNGNKIDRQAIADQLQQAGYGDLNQDVQNTLDQAAFQNGSMNGSRRVNLGGIVGSGIGLATGHPFIGASVGGGIGAFLDKYGPQTFKNMLDTGMFTQETLGKLANTQYAQPLINALQNGNHSLSTTMFILGQNDPEFRKVMQGNSNGQ